MSGWRLARSLEVLRAEIDAAHPDRDRSSDGTIGDAAHIAQGSASDHNPNAFGVVRALDVDAGPGLYPRPPLDALAVELAERVRLLGLAGFEPLQDGGYVIWHGRIASEVQHWAWRSYYGSSPHLEHVHISVSRDPSRYDLETPWRLPLVQPPTPAQLPSSVKPTPAAVPAPNSKGLRVPVVDLRSATAAHLITGPGVRALQALLEAAGDLRGPLDGTGGPGTRAALLRFQARTGLTADAIAGPETFTALLRL